MNQPSQDQGISLDTVRLVVSSFLEAMRSFEGDRYQQQLAEVTCVGLSWIVEDRLAGVNAPEWPALCEDLLKGIGNATPDGFGEALRRYGGFSDLAAAAFEIAGENKIDLKELAAALPHARELTRRVSEIQQQR
ncbi:MAG: hypothetical protein KIT16_10115 [Rhodospirillaceae bacterium]|nr:hypothetical protein [Rhodospirillaceae bacterium]